MVFLIVSILSEIFHSGKKRKKGKRESRREEERGRKEIGCLVGLDDLGYNGCATLALSVKSRTFSPIKQEQVDLSTS